MNFTFEARNVEVQPVNGNSLNVSGDAHEDDILDNILVEDAVSYYGSTALLDAIGVAEVKAYFGLVGAE